jgi:uncharacterized protein (TIGR02271 family)
VATEELGSDREVMLPLMEEALRVGKRRVEAGRVRVSLTTETEERLVSEMLRSDRVEVERIAVDREISSSEVTPSVRNEDGVVIVPVFEEVLVVEKRLVLREEIRLRIAVSADPAEQTVSLRRQRVEVERLPAKDAAVMDAPEGTADSAPMDADATEVFLADRLSERR